MTRMFAKSAWIPAISVAAFVVAGCSSTPKESVVQYHASYPHFRTSGELADRADLIVRGTPIASRVEELFMDESAGDNAAENPQLGVPQDEAEEARRESSVVVTISTMKVEEVVKGDVAVNETVEVLQLGGKLNNVVYKNDETTLVSPGGDYVMFLAAHGAGKPLDLLNPQQALYVTENDGDTLSPADKHDEAATADLNIDNVAAIKQEVTNN